MVREGGRHWPHPFPHPHPARAPFLVSRPLAPLAHPDSKLERRAEEQTSSYHSPYPGLYGQGQELGFPLSGSQESSRRDSLNTVCPSKPRLMLLQDSSLTRHPGKQGQLGQHPSCSSLGKSCPSHCVQEMSEGHCSWANRTHSSGFFSDHSLWTQGSILAFRHVVSIELGTL